MNTVTITRRCAITGRLVQSQVTYCDPPPARGIYVREAVAAVVVGLVGALLYLVVVLMQVSL